MTREELSAIADSFTSDLIERKILHLVMLWDDKARTMAMHQNTSNPNEAATALIMIAEAFAKQARRDIDDPIVAVAFRLAAKALRIALDPIMDVIPEMPDHMTKMAITDEEPKH